VRDEERPFVRQAKRHLAAHLAERFSLAELAGAVGISPSHLRQAFTADVGVSPSAYLTRLRVDRAAELLTAGRPIKEVAATVGFCDPSHLTRRFKRLRGVTPARYAARA
jgi:AraC-like DNA-binding protein